MRDPEMEQYTAAGTFPWKLIRAKEDVVGGRFGIRPVHIQVNPTNRCNGSCPWCFCGNSDRSAELGIEEIESICSCFQGLGTKAVTLSGGGEPTVHPEFRRIVSTCRRHGFSVGLTTNGMAWKAGAIPDASGLEKEIDWIRISAMDTSVMGPQPEAIENIATQIRVNIGISVTVTEGTRAGLVEEICRIANLHENISHIRFTNDVLNPDDKMLGWYEWYARQRTSKGIYQYRGVYDRGSPQCLVSKLRPLVDADGLVYPCCGIHYAQGGDYSRKMPVELSMGRWDRFETAKPFDGRSCRKCYYGEYNLVLAKMIAPMANPYHV